MTIAAIDAGASAKPRSMLAAMPLWAWCLLAVAVSTGLALLAKGPGRTFEFIDSDDALRFIHVRELLAGAPWFEITTKAIGGTDGLVSHWSRLIDGPLAILLGAFRLLFAEPVARNVTITVWPLMILGALLWAIARTTLQVAGRRAAHLALVFAATSLLTYYQFAPGRIDHHNVMITATLAAGLVVWAWPDDARMWRLSGILCAVALAIGYEALAPVFLVACCLALWGLVAPEKSAHAEGFVASLVVTLAIVLAATVLPSRWLTITCDALSLNVVVLSAIAGAGYVAVIRTPSLGWPTRIGVLGVSSAIGVAAFGWLEPACLAGPMGQVPPELGPAWMDHADEAKSLLREALRGEIAATIGPVLILAAGLCVTVGAFLGSDRSADRYYLIFVACFVVLALWQMKYVAYASLVVVPGLAVFVSRLGAFGNVGAPVVTAAAVLLLNHFALFALANKLKPSATRAPANVAVAAADAEPVSPQMACTKADALRSLGAVPAGLVVTHNDVGAHLAAATGHRALSGPYHRIPRAIIANGGILAAKDPVVAGRLLAREKADYVLTCSAMDKAQLALPGWDGSLLEALAADRPPGFLVAVRLADAPLYRLWRVDRERLPQP